MQRQAQYFPRRINVHVPNLQYASEVMYGGEGFVYLQDEGKFLIAADTDGILAAASIATALDTAEFADTYSDDAMGKYGRNVTVAASGAATSTVTVHGFDYLGQPMIETLTLNGTTGVAGKKAFKTIAKVEAGVTAATTINVGWGNVLGLPFRAIKLEAEFVNDTIPTAGTFVAGVSVTQTATSGDPRGTYTPHSGSIPDGTRAYRIAAYFDDGNLHGDAHFAG